MSAKLLLSLFKGKHIMQLSYLGTLFIFVHSINSFPSMASIISLNVDRDYGMVTNLTRHRSMPEIVRETSRCGSE